MPIVEVAPVTRKGMKLLLALFGMSETGKTHTALLVASGIQPNPKRRGLLDTEGGQRGRAYADAIPGGFMYGELTAPFTPERYMEALLDFAAAGVDTLVIDSASHAWFAAGGVLDMVEQATGTNDIAKWAKPKRRLGRMTQLWLSCGMHLILCSRGKQPLVESEEKQRNGKPKMVPGPVVPIQEKSLRFDMTIMALMLGDGRFSIAKEDGGKCPVSLRAVLTENERMGEALGRQLAAWAGGEDTTTPSQRLLRLKADEVAGHGVEAFRAYWRDLPAHDRAFLRNRMANLQSIAAAADADAAAALAAEREQATEKDLDDPFGAAAAEAALPEGVQAPDPFADPFGAAARGRDGASQAAAQPQGAAR